MNIWTWIPNEHGTLLQGIEKIYHVLGERRIPPRNVKTSFINSL